MRRSKISLQSRDVRAKIDRLLVDAGFAGYEWLVQHIRDEFGVDAGEKSSLQRYGAKLQRRLAAVKASTEAARLIADAAPDEADERSNAIISLVQTEIFDSLVAMQEAQDETNPVKRVEMLGKAAKNIATLTRASVARNRWAAEVQAKARIVADHVEKIARQGGLSKETSDEFRREILGIAA